MTKAEMELHREQYYALLTSARAAIHDGGYRQAIELATSSWGHIDGMMQYERKYEGKESISIDAIDTVLTLAPLLFDIQSLDELESLLKNQRRIEKNSSADLNGNLARARQLLWDAHRMWDHVEQNPNCRQDELRKVLEGEQDQWRGIAEQWEKFGLLLRTPENNSYRLIMSTRMHDTVRAKCSSCGVIAKAPKAKFLDDVACPKCKETVSFVLLEVK